MINFPPASSAYYPKARPWQENPAINLADAIITIWKWMQPALPPPEENPLSVLALHLPNEPEGMTRISKKASGLAHSYIVRYKDKTITQVLKDRSVIIASGTCKTIKLYTDINTQRDFAFAVLGDPAQRKLFKKEIKLNGVIEHPFILTGEEVSWNKKTGLLMPRCAGNMQEFKAQVPMAQKRRCARQIARAIHYLLGKNMPHFDIKPENILLKKTQEQWTALLADFGGVSVWKEHQLINHTKDLSAPELFLTRAERNKKLSTPEAREKAIIYSLGCTLGEWYHTDTLTTAELHLLQKMKDPSAEKRPSLAHVITILDGQDHQPL